VPVVDMNGEVYLYYVGAATQSQIGLRLGALLPLNGRRANVPLPYTHL